MAMAVRDLFLLCDCVRGLYVALSWANCARVYRRTCHGGSARRGCLVTGVPVTGLCVRSSLYICVGVFLCVLR